MVGLWGENDVPPASREPHGLGEGEPPSGGLWGPGLQVSYRQHCGIDGEVAGLQA